MASMAAVAIPGRHVYSHLDRSADQSSSESTQGSQYFARQPPPMTSSPVPDPSNHWPPNAGRAPPHTIKTTISGSGPPCDVKHGTPIIRQVAIPQTHQDRDSHSYNAAHVPSPSCERTVPGLKEAKDVVTHKSEGQDNTSGSFGPRHGEIQPQRTVRGGDEDVTAPYSMLHYELSALVRMAAETDDERAKKKAAQSELLILAQRLWGRQVTVVMHGSSSSGAALRKSDVDLVISGVPNLPPPDRSNGNGYIPFTRERVSTFLDALHQVIFEETEIAVSGTIVRSARMPLLTLKMSSGVDVDITLGINSSLETTQILEKLFREVQHARPLLLAFKAILGGKLFEDLRGLHAGGLSSFCATLMVLSYCKWRAVHGGSGDLGEALIGLLAFFTGQGAFDINVHAIDVLARDGLSLKSEKQQAMLEEDAAQLRARLCVVEPVGGHDVGLATFRVPDCMERLKDLHTTLLNSDSLSPCHSPRAAMLQGLCAPNTYSTRAAAAGEKTPVLAISEEWVLDHIPLLARILSVSTLLPLSPRAPPSPPPPTQNAKPTPEESPTPNGSLFVQGVGALPLGNLHETLSIAGMDVAPPPNSWSATQATPREHISSYDSFGPRCTSPSSIPPAKLSILLSKTASLSPTKHLIPSYAASPPHPACKDVDITPVNSHETLSTVGSLIQTITVSSTGHARTLSYSDEYPLLTESNGHSPRSNRSPRNTGTSIFARSGRVNPGNQARPSRDHSWADRDQLHASVREVTSTPVDPPTRALSAESRWTTDVHINGVTAVSNRSLVLTHQPATNTDVATGAVARTFARAQAPVRVMSAPANRVPHPCKAAEQMPADELLFNIMQPDRTEKVHAMNSGAEQHVADTSDKYTDSPSSRQHLARPNSINGSGTGLDAANGYGEHSTQSTHYRSWAAASTQSPFDNAALETVQSIEGYNPGPNAVPLHTDYRSSRMTSRAALSTGSRHSSLNVPGIDRSQAYHSVADGYDEFSNPYTSLENVPGMAPSMRSKLSRSVSCQPSPSQSCSVSSHNSAQAPVCTTWPTNHASLTPDSNAHSHIAIRTSQCEFNSLPQAPMQQHRAVVHTSAAAPIPHTRAGVSRNSSAQHPAFNPALNRAHATSRASLLKPSNSQGNLASQQQLHHRTHQPSSPTQSAGTNDEHAHQGLTSDRKPSGLRNKSYKAPSRVSTDTDFDRSGFTEGNAHLLAGSSAPVLPGYPRSNTSRRASAGSGSTNTYSSAAVCTSGHLDGQQAEGNLHEAMANCLKPRESRSQPHLQTEPTPDPVGMPLPIAHFTSAREPLADAENARDTSAQPLGVASDASHGHDSRNVREHWSAHNGSKGRNVGGMGDHDGPRGTERSNMNQAWTSDQMRLGRGRQHKAFDALGGRGRGRQNIRSFDPSRRGNAQVAGRIAPSTPVAMSRDHFSNETLSRDYANEMPGSRVTHGHSSYLEGHNSGRGHGSKDNHNHQNMKIRQSYDSGKVSVDAHLRNAYTCHGHLTPPSPLLGNSHILNTHRVQQQQQTTTPVRAHEYAPNTGINHHMGWGSPYAPDGGPSPFGPPGHHQQQAIVSQAGGHPRNVYMQPLAYSGVPPFDVRHTGAYVQEPMQHRNHNAATDGRVGVQNFLGPPPAGAPAHNRSDGSTVVHTNMPPPMLTNPAAAQSRHAGPPRNPPILIQPGYHHHVVSVMPHPAHSANHVPTDRDVYFHSPRPVMLVQVQQVHHAHIPMNSQAYRNTPMYPDPHLIQARNTTPGPMMVYQPHMQRMHPMMHPAHNGPR